MCTHPTSARRASPPSLPCQCYNKVLACCARARLPELAEEWLDKMEAAGVPPDLISYSTTISAYAKVKHRQAVSDRTLRHT